MATDARRYLANWQDEIDSVALYGALADLEPDGRLADVYRPSRRADSPPGRSPTIFLDTMGRRIRSYIPTSTVEGPPTRSASRTSRAP